MSFYYVYVLRNSETGKLYIGYSSNLRQRLRGHASGDTSTTRGRKYILIYFEGHLNKADAIGREKFLKGGSGRKYLNKQLTHYFAENAFAR
ncbi:MAG: GIY-YIG nuclease family protein [Candidatus Andersenbacteria bacterium]|nr:GIY-YIG nuclease family protein [Candidatus Andersenbacteria bacterium]